MPGTPSALFLFRKMCHVPDYFLSSSLKHNEIKQASGCCMPPDRTTCSALALSHSYGFVLG